MKTKNTMTCVDCGCLESLWLADDPEWQCDDCVASEDDGVPWGVECNHDLELQEYEND